MDTESRLSTEGRFYLGLNYRSEETCDTSSMPWKQNTAIWKPLTVTGAVVEMTNQRGLHVGLG